MPMSTGPEVGSSGEPWIPKARGWGKVEVEAMSPVTWATGGVAVE